MIMNTSVSFVSRIKVRQINTDNIIPLSGFQESQGGELLPTYNAAESSVVAEHCKEIYQQNLSSTVSHLPV